MNLSLYTILQLYIHWCMLRAQPMITASMDPNGQSIMHVLNIYIMHLLKLL